MGNDDERALGHQGYRNTFAFSQLFDSRIRNYFGGMPNNL